MARLRRILRLLLPCLLLVANGWAQSSADEDVLLRTLQQQVDSLYHSFDKAVDPVYLLSVRVEKVDDYHFLSAMGDDMGGSWERYARMSVQIRVGNGEIDNYYPLGDASDDACLQGKVYDIPLDGNAAAVAQVLSQATQEAYQEARARYHRVLAALRDISRPQAKRGDFVLEPAVTYYEPPVAPLIREEALRQSLATCTRALVRAEAYECTADLHFQNVRSYLVTSDGTSIAQNNPLTLLTVTLTATADDGTPLALPKRYERTLPEELPLGEELARDVQAQEKLLEQMRRARVASAAVCPVLFEEQAATVYWQYAFVPLLLQQNPPLETQLTPDGWQVVSNPAINTFQNAVFPAAYRYDDEGQEAERVQLLENGRLVAVPDALASSRYLRLSNGHGRALLGCHPMPAPGNLIITCHDALSADALRTRLKQAIARQGAEFGYRVSTAALDEQNHSVQALVAWKVYADNRPDEPVYGLKLSGSPRVLLSQMEAGGGMLTCAGLECEGVSYQCCTPGLLIGTMEALAVAPAKRTPIKPALTFNTEKGEDDEDEAEVFFEAMNDDIRQVLATDGKGYDEAYYVSHLITDAQQCQVESSMGSTVAMSVRPVRDVSTCVLVGDEQFNNDNVEGEGLEMQPVSLPLNNNYNHIRRVLRTQTDEAYKTAVRQFAEKEQVLQLLNDSVRRLLQPNSRSMQTKNITLHSMYNTMEPNRLENLANAISSAFEKQTFLTGSRVVVDGFQGSVYFCASDGVRYEQPVNLLRIRLEAQAQAADGTCLRDVRERLYRNLGDLDDIASLQALAAQMAEELHTWMEAPVWNGDYNGPVLLEGEAVTEMAAYTLVENSPNLLAPQPTIRLNPIDNHPHLVRATSLASRIDRQVFSRAMDLDALDSREAYSGTPLVGSSVIDADGAPVEERVEIVRRGELISLLGGRASVTNGNNARGHRRFALREGRLAVASGPGVLELTCHSTLPDKQLYKMLRKRARASGMRYALIIHKTIQEDGGCKPLYVSKIDVSSGKITPVRLADPFSFNLFDFVQMEASSKGKEVSNRMVSPYAGEGNGDVLFSKEEVPCSFILPEKILFRNINTLKHNN